MEHGKRESPLFYVIHPLGEPEYERVCQMSSTHLLRPRSSLEHAAFHPLCKLIKTVHPRLNLRAALLSPFWYLHRSLEQNGCLNGMNDRSKLRLALQLVNHAALIDLLEGMSRSCLQ